MVEEDQGYALVRTEPPVDEGTPRTDTERFGVFSYDIGAGELDGVLMAGS
ncbi:hypothetical protein [Streptomyces sp. NPDC017202]